MKREIVLDTETTGLDPSVHGIIEIGCLEIFDRRVTQKDFHVYINPRREIDEAAIAVHGITMAQLRDKPPFEEVAEQFLAFVGDADLVIHNADFDMSFLAAEFERCGRSADWPPAGQVIDTLPMAREKHPGQRNSLDALCKRYEVDNSGRDLHGALLDAGLLAEVYLRMTGGQNSLVLESRRDERDDSLHSVAQILAEARAELQVISPSAEELSAHDGLLEKIREESGQCLWLDQATNSSR